MGIHQHSPTFTSITYNHILTLTNIHPHIHQSRRDFLPFSHTPLPFFTRNYTHSFLGPATTHPRHTPYHLPKTPLPLSFQLRLTQYQHIQSPPPNIYLSSR